MIPGVSRSGATIVGAMLLGTDKRSAAEFSFFLAMPTMAGAFAYDLYKNWSILHASDVANIALGFVTAFIAAVFVVRYLLDYVSRHGFAVFGWWRIIVGGIALGAMLVLGQTHGLPGHPLIVEVLALGGVRRHRARRERRAARRHRAHCADASRTEGSRTTREMLASAFR